jgi:hypothetical protein
MTPRFEIYQLPHGEWTVVRLPENYQNGDLLPLPKPSDPRFDTQAEAADAMYEQIRQARFSLRSRRAYRHRRDQ